MKVYFLCFDLLYLLFLDMFGIDLLINGRLGYDRMSSFKGVEWDRDEEENLVFYGKFINYVDRS